MNAPQPNNLAIGYARRSTVNQKDNTSLNDQMRRIQLQAEVKGLEVHHIAFDDGLSGSNVNRPGLWDAISMLKCIKCQPLPFPDKLTGDAWMEPCNCEAMQGADTLIVWDFKRFGRNSEETIFLCLEVLDRLGKRLVIVDGDIQIDTSTPMGRFMLRLFASMAELDKEELVEKMKRGKHYIRKHSIKFAGGVVPYGFRTDNERKSGSNLVPKVDPNTPQEGEYAILKYIYLLHIQGLSVRQIAQELNGEKLKRKTRSGGHWHATQVWRVLNPDLSKQPQLRGEVERLHAEVHKEMKMVAERQKVKS